MESPTEPVTHEPRLWQYFWALLGATRPHFFALPIGASFAGVGATGVDLTARSLLLLALIAGGGWASGQLLNDVLDREADAIDAPNRAAVRGLLPAKTTIAIALTFGSGLLLLLTSLTPLAWQLGLLSMALILTYNRFKALPALGNISHGALIACASLIGASVALPDSKLRPLIADTLPITLLVALWAALYLQGNYEKDARGDAAAGYKTLAHLLGTRGSAIARSIVALVSGVLFWQLLPSVAYSIPAVASSILIAGSAIRVAWKADARTALTGYRWTVHGAVLGMLALGGPALPLGAYGALIGVAVLLTEHAFSRSPNP